MYDRYPIIALECHGKFKVGIDPAEFLEQFLPWGNSTPQAYRDLQPSDVRKNHLKDMASKSPESAMYPCFVAAMDGWPLSDISDWDASSKPRSALETEFQRYTGVKDTIGGGVGTDIFQYHKGKSYQNGYGGFAKSESHIEFKREAWHDPFRTPTNPSEPAISIDTPMDHEEGDTAKLHISNDHVAPGDSEIRSRKKLEIDNLQKSFPYENYTEMGKRVRGQIAAYAAVSMHMAFRSHLFTLVIAGPFMRFVRWDRRGAVVSSRFTYADSLLPFEFYSRFAQLTRSQRGYDESVQELDPEGMILGRPCTTLIREALAAFDSRSREVYRIDHTSGTRDGAKAATDLLLMTTKFDGKVRTFIVTRPRFEYGCLSPFSRATRRCWAYDIEEKRVYFMKDYWREDSERTKPEAEIYRMLNTRNIPHVARLHTGGDVEGLVTRWQELDVSSEESRNAFPQGWLDKYKRPLWGHRLFLSTIARDLQDFDTARNLVNCVADAVEACEEAHSQLGILHRDISAGNIMIDSSADIHDRGVLIDWDHCILLDRGNSMPRYERTGTWQFMSVQLADPKRNCEPHSILDDRESFFWVLLYMAYRFLPNDQDATCLYNLLVLTFDWKAFDQTGSPVDQGTRFAHLRAISEGDPDLQSSIPQFDELLRTLAQVFHSRYIPVGPDRLVSYEWNKAATYPSKEVERSTMMQYWDFEARKNLESVAWLRDTLRSFVSKIPVRSNPDGTIQKDYIRNVVVAEHGMQERGIRESMKTLDSGRGPIFFPLQEDTLHKPATLKRSLPVNISENSRKKSRTEDLGGQLLTDMDE